MPIYDNNWKSYALYVASTVESGCNYGAIETYAMAGIGLMQWTYDRSWSLLNLMATDYPDTESLFPILWNSIKSGTSSWGQKVFTQSEANEISNALITTQGKATQQKQWALDCDNLYIPLLKDQCSLQNPWGSIFGFTIHHQAPNAYWQVYNGVGDSDQNGWYIGAINNGIVGKYLNRQNTVKSLLDQWDGESGKEGFEVENPSDLNGGNNNPNEGNPDDTFAKTLSKVTIRGFQKMGKEQVLNLVVNKKPRKMQFFKASDGLYYPIVTEENVEGETPTTPVPPAGGTGTNEDLDWIVNTMISLESTLQYSQAQSLRTNIEGGYCDCSGLVWWLYNKRGIGLGTWTGTQKENGTLIAEGGGGNAPDESLLQIGDLCLFDWDSTSYTDTGHIELYIGGGTLMGHGGSPPIGPVRKDWNYWTYANAWMVRRIITI